MSRLELVRQGFTTIEADTAFKERALSYLSNWLTHDDFLAYRPQIEWLIDSAKWSVLLDSFYQVLPFGTGGRRGAVGIGPNRMNLWTLTASVQGHCAFLRERFPNAKSPLQVVLAYDVRQFEDKRGVYNPSLPNPILHLSSKDFVHAATCVYAANGVESHILPADSKRFLSTPELSFAIRHLNAHGGLNVTASHNPPDDNGGKFYDERGGQSVPPDDQIMSDLVDKVTVIHSLPWADAVRTGKIHWLTDETHQGYIDLCRKQSLIPPPKFDEFRVVFTPLHGVGAMGAMEVLEAQGFRPIPVEEQMQPDGQFPNVTQSPNPEVPVSLDRAEKVAKSVQANLLLATDPDADRIGAMASYELNGGGEYRYITGNEIGALLTHYKLSQLTAQRRLPKSPIVVKTEVTSTLTGRIARHFNAQLADGLLVGFKYIAEVLWQLESTGQFEDVRGTPADFIIGVEESHGILLTDAMRDKDAAAAALLLAEMALDQKRHGRTVPQYLESLWKQFGYFRNDGVNIIMPGIEGKVHMTKMLDALRTNPPTEISGLSVVKFEDLRDENGRMGPLKGGTDAASRNFLIFRLADFVHDGHTLSARVVLRPSGTEPKAKAYIEVGSAPYTSSMSAEKWKSVCEAVDAKCKQLGQEFVKLAMSTVGL